MIQTRDEEGVRIIELARPDKRNAMLPEMLELLHDAITSDGPHRAIAMFGQGNAFCAGFDLKACAADPSGDTMRALLTGLSRCVFAMRESAAPIVLGIHGAAVAGGCALLGGADIVIAERNTQLGYPVVKIGVSPAVSSPFMLSAMHPGVVRNRLVDTQLIDAQRAYRLGMVHEIFDSQLEVSNRTVELACAFAAKPGLGCIATKQWLNEISAVQSDDAKQGLNASLSLTGGEEEQTMLAALWGS